MKHPLISVIMPVYNVGSYVFDAVSSILRQTFDDFEFIIVDDASTDNTRDILDAMHDYRIVRINNTIHSGNYKCRNQGLAFARGKYICVMDGDDIACPDRLLKQYRFMESNPEYMAAGSDIEFFADGSSPSFLRRIRDPEQIKVHLLRDNVCTHPTLIIRKEVFRDYHIRYNEAYYYSSDYDLLLTISCIGSVTNMPDTLLRYRMHKSQVTISKWKEQTMYADQIRLKQLSFFKLRPSVEEMMIHLSLMNNYPVARTKLPSVEKWCNKLLDKNSKLGVYHQEFLYKFLQERIKYMIDNSF